MDDLPTPYDERRLAVIIADARAALAGGCTYDRAALAAYAGKLEALLMMLADSAEAEIGARRADSGAGS
jgi:hypothetical protein